MAPHVVATGTISLRAVPPSVIIHNPDGIPDAYMRQPPAVPDKKLILDRLKAGEDIPGAGLSNGGMTVAISRR